MDFSTGRGALGGVFCVGDGVVDGDWFFVDVKVLVVLFFAFCVNVGVLGLGASCGLGGGFVFDGGADSFVDFVIVVGGVGVVVFLLHFDGVLAFHVNGVFGFHFECDVAFVIAFVGQLFRL